VGVRPKNNSMVRKLYNMIWVVGVIKLRMESMSCAAAPINILLRQNCCVLDAQ
jgi:hypothetical protein